MYDSSFPPKVSVLCLSYNHEPYLRQALDSILMQKTNFAFEVLVGEDCSPDRSREILQEYENRYPGFFQILYREKNMGATRNSYDLCMRAKGQYIATLETDDYWTSPYKLQKQVDFLDTHPEYIGCAHDCKQVNENGDILRESRLHHSLKSGNIVTLQCFCHKGFIFHTSTLMYRNFFQDGDDYSIIYKSHPLVGDLTVFSMLLLRGNIYLLLDCMSVCRIVIKQGGTSAASIAMMHRAESLEAGMRQLFMLEKYFQGEIDYSHMKLQRAKSYLSGWLKREIGFTTQGMRYMWDHVDSAGRKELVCFALGYPVRKVKKCWHKIWKREESNG